MTQDQSAPTPLAGAGVGLGQGGGHGGLDENAAGGRGAHSGERDWRRLRDIGIATLAWLTVVAVVFWGLAHVISAVLLFILAAILAYALSPAVKHLERFMPRGVAIALVYVGILTTLSGLIYLIVITAVGQVSMLLTDLQSLLAPGPDGQESPLVGTFKAVGLSDTQIHSAANRMLQQVQNLTGDAVSIAASVLDAVVRTILVGVLSIYLLKDGPQVITWLRTSTPLAQRRRVVFFVDTLDTVVGGYIRGQLTLSALIGVMVGAGMWLFHVPYAVFLGVLAFVLEFVPLVGVFVSGAICVVLALTVGWLTAVFVLAYFAIVHFIEGDFVGPRIMSRAIGLHPAVSILALFAGAELFGIWGALFAAPVAGLVQAVLRAVWLEWRSSHPEEFPTGYTVTQEVRVVPVTHAEAPALTTVEAEVTSEPGELLYPEVAGLGLRDGQWSGAPTRSNGSDGRTLDEDADADLEIPVIWHDLATASADPPPSADGASPADGRSLSTPPVGADARLLPDVAAWARTPSASLYDQFDSVQPEQAPAESDSASAAPAEAGAANGRHPLEPHAPDEPKIAPKDAPGIEPKPAGGPLPA